MQSERKKYGNTKLYGYLLQHNVAILDVLCTLQLNAMLILAVFCNAIAENIAVHSVLTNCVHKTSVNISTQDSNIQR